MATDSPQDTCVSSAGTIKNILHLINNKKIQCAKYDLRWAYVYFTSGWCAESAGSKVTFTFGLSDSSLIGFLCKSDVGHIELYI